MIFSSSLVRIELKQYENMDRAERQLIKSVERKEIKKGDRTESNERREKESMCLLIYNSNIQNR